MKAFVYVTWTGAMALLVAKDLPAAKRKLKTRAAKAGVELDQQFDHAEEIDLSKPSVLWIADVPEEHPHAEVIEIAERLKKEAKQAKKNRKQK